MTDKYKIKILLVTHKSCAIPNLECIVPIHAGRAIAMENSKDGRINDNEFKWLIENTIGDDNGDNISKQNRYYSECSTIYWAWKNYDKIDNPDFIGLMHYRRHFIFNEHYYDSKDKNIIEKVYEVLFEKFINKLYCEKIGLNDNSIYNALRNTDIIVSKYTHFDLFGDINLRQDYEKNIEGTKVKDFDLMIKTVLRLYPEYKTVIEKYINGYSKLSFNMFIMKKELFFTYCEFLFNILFEMEKFQNFNEYTINGKRTPGYIAEILLTIFVWKLEEEKTVNIKHLGITKVDFPHTESKLKEILSEECPSYWSYLYNKLKFLLTMNNNRKTKYKNIRRKREEYKKLQKEWKEQYNAN